MDTRIYADILRHRFTNLIRNSGDTNSCAIGPLTRTMNIINQNSTVINETLEQNNLIESNFTNRVENTLNFLFEGRYHFSPEDLEDDFLVPNNGRLIPEKKGVLIPDNSEWGLLIDHRSWTQLKNECSVDKEDIHFLSTGHRLIRKKIVNKFEKLSSFPTTDLYPIDPIDWIIGQFHDWENNPPGYDSEDWEEEWINCTNEERGWLNLYSNDMKMKFGRPRNYQWWDKEPKSTLQIKNNGIKYQYNIIRRYRKTEWEIEGQLNDPKLHFELIENRVQDGEIYEKRVCVFNNSIPSPSHLGLFQNLRLSDKRRFIFENFRDTIRAFLACIKKLDLVNGNDVHHGLAPFVFRNTILSNNDSDMYKQIMKIDPVLSEWLRDITLNRLWFTNTNNN